ncbi:hypothetical protein GW17_00008525, partial [Ensete ventricosum]
LSITFGELPASPNHLRQAPDKPSITFVKLSANSRQALYHLRSGPAGLREEEAERSRAEREWSEAMESFLKRNFDVAGKHPSEDAQRRWRSAVGAVVKNRRRRFRMVPDLDQRCVVEAKKRKIQVTKPEKTSPNLSPSFSISIPCRLLRIAG